MPVPGPQALRGAASDAAFLRAQGLSGLGAVPGQVDELPPRPRAFLPEQQPGSGRRHEGQSQSFLPRLPRPEPRARPEKSAEDRDRSHERGRSHDRGRADRERHERHERSHSPIRLPDIHLSTRETSDRDVDSSPDARPRDTSPSASSNLEGSSRRTRERDRSEPRTLTLDRPNDGPVRRRERDDDRDGQDGGRRDARRGRPNTGRARSPVPQEERAIEEALRGEPPRLRADGFGVADRAPDRKRWGAGPGPSGPSAEKPPRAYLPYISPSKAPGPKLGVPGRAVCAASQAWEPPPAWRRPPERRALRRPPRGPARAAA